MNSTFLCYNLVDLCAEINAPLRQTQRIQYTCLDASSNYIVLGATSGSIYIFRRGATVKFLQIIQNMYGPINHIAISPQEKFVTFSTVKGTICVYVIDLNAAYPQIVTAHYEDTLVTCLHWKRNEEQMYYGDQKGNVFVVNLTSFLGRNLTHISIHPILFLDSAIVEISDLDKLLLVSNYSKCILCNTESEEFKQIGNTPRDGYYGACFLPAPNKINLADSKVFCARPGSRLWEVDVEGRVLQTSQYKLALACPPTPTFNSTQPPPSPIVPAVELDSELTPGELKKTPQLLHRLQPIFGRFIFSYNRNGFYIFDPARTTIVLWNDQIRDIQTVRIVNGCTLVIFTNHSQVFSITCRSLEEGFVDMLNERQLEDCVRLLLLNQSYFKELCLTQGYVANILKLKNALDAERTSVSDECRSVLSECVGLVATDIVPTLVEQQIRRHENGVYAVDNAFANANRYHRNNANNVDDNIKAAFLSASRNILNRLNIFNEAPDTANVNNANAPMQQQHQQHQHHQPNDRAQIIIPYQNIDTTTDNSDEIVAPNFRRVRPSAGAAAAAAHRQRITAATQLSAEEKQLQDLFMIYKSSRISGLPLVERYSHIFDKYDGDAMQDLLHRLAMIMVANGIEMTTARLHCYEMYFHYLNADLVWEFDETMRQYVIDGFVLVNQECEARDIQRCADCRYPLYQSTAQPRKRHFVELGVSIFKYFWSRNQPARCFEMATLVPWTMELCCKFQLQQLTADPAASAANRKTLRHLFACGNAALLQSAIDQTDGFTPALWDEYAALMVGLHNDALVLCPQCDSPQAQRVENVAALLLQNDFYAWPPFFDTLVQQQRGRNAIALIKKFAGQIPEDAIPKEFYLKCLLVP